jgi:hypothetical protein
MDVKKVCWSKIDEPHSTTKEDACERLTKIKKTRRTTESFCGTFRAKNRGNLRLTL